MSNKFVYPKPRSWEDFEDIVADIYRRKYNQNNFQRYGRSGQRQDGVDIAGFVPNEGLVGIQCKHKVKTEITEAEILDEIENAENFRPNLHSYIFATSSPRDNKIHEFVLQINETRIQQSQFGVEIVFWEDIIIDLTDFPDLLYKHITKYFPTTDAENISVIAQSRNKRTASYPISNQELNSLIEENLQGLLIADKYEISIGVSSFDEVSFDEIVDIKFQFAEYFQNSIKADSKFLDMAEIIRKCRQQISKSLISKDMWIYAKIRLSLAFLIGWLFPKVAGYNLYIVNYPNNNVYTTSNLMPVSSNLNERLPKIYDVTSEDIVICLNISRDITQSVMNFIEAEDTKPRALVIFDQEGYRVNSSAHALSVAIAIANRIKKIVDVEQVKHIHLFASLPASLAILITHRLNAIVPISLYHRGSENSKYILSGTLNSELQR